MPRTDRGIDWREKITTADALIPNRTIPGPGSRPSTLERQLADRSRRQFIQGVDHTRNVATDHGPVRRWQNQNPERPSGNGLLMSDVLVGRHDRGESGGLRSRK